jgi:hypothetical protein
MVSVDIVDRDGYDAIAAANEPDNREEQQFCEHDKPPTQFFVPLSRIVPTDSKCQGAWVLKVPGAKVLSAEVPRAKCSRCEALRVLRHLGPLSTPALRHPGTLAHSVATDFDAPV